MIPPINFSHEAKVRNQNRTLDLSPKREVDKRVYNSVIIPFLLEKNSPTVDILSLPGELAVWEQGLLDALDETHALPPTTLRVTAAENSPAIWRKLKNRVRYHNAPEVPYWPKTNHELTVDVGPSIRTFRELCLRDDDKKYDIVYFDSTHRYSAERLEQPFELLRNTDKLADHALFGLTFCYVRTQNRDIAHLPRPGVASTDARVYLENAKWPSSPHEGRVNAVLYGVAKQFCQIFGESNTQCKLIHVYKNKCDSNLAMVMIQHWFEYRKKG